MYVVKTGMWGVSATAPSGEELRDAGIEQALEDQEIFSACVCDHVIRNMKGMHVSGEDIRLSVEDKCPSPRSPHAWGGVISAMVKRGVLQHTGLIKKLTDPRGHARRTTIWLVT